MKITDFPIIEKSVFMDNFNTINTVGVDVDECMDVATRAEESRDFTPMINGVSVGLSTGTSGNRGVFLVTSEERAMWVAGVLDRVIGFSFSKRRVAFFLRANSNLYSSTQSKLLEFTFYDIFKEMSLHLEKINVQKPHIVVAQPSVLIILAKVIEEKKLDISPMKVISVAEVLTPEDRLLLERTFKQTIHQVYQCTEGFLAASCEYGNLHFNEDFLHIEKAYLDEEKTKFQPIITDLLRRSQPIVRYQLKDIISELGDCACGSRMLGIHSIDGRMDDVISLRNELGDKVSLFPDLFRRTIVLSDDDISDYYLGLVSEDRLELFIESKCNNAYENASKAILDLLGQYRIHHVAVSRIDQIPTEDGGKKRRIRNETS